MHRHFRHALLANFVRNDLQSPHGGNPKSIIDVTNAPPDHGTFCTRCIVSSEWVESETRFSQFQPPTPAQTPAPGIIPTITAPPEMPFCHTIEINARGEIVRETFTARAGAIQRFITNDDDMNKRVLERIAELKQADRTNATRANDIQDRDERDHWQHAGEDQDLTCPECGSDCYDNRRNRRPGDKRPLIKCKNPDCDYRVWGKKKQR